jgi:hypothetical protein
VVNGQCVESAAANGVMLWVALALTLAALSDDAKPGSRNGNLRIKMHHEHREMPGELDRL